MKLSHGFDVLAHHASRGMGHPVTFVVALLLVLTWGLSGPALGFSDSWQLLINTGTTISTFLMVFLIQHTQNRDSAALHLKLDELLRAVEGARNSVIALEDLDEADLMKLQDHYRHIAETGKREAVAPETKSRPPQRESPVPVQSGKR
jgi:low affinity Fe/Cu permease